MIKIDIILLLIAAILCIHVITRPADAQHEPKVHPSVAVEEDNSAAIAGIIGQM